MTSSNGDVIGTQRLSGGAPSFAIRNWCDNGYSIWCTFSVTGHNMKFYKNIVDHVEHSLIFTERECGRVHNTQWEGATGIQSSDILTRTIDGRMEFLNNN